MPEVKCRIVTRYEVRITLEIPKLQVRATEYGRVSVIVIGTTRYCRSLEEMACDACFAGSI
jgi:hypothetical protein